MQESTTNAYAAGMARDNRPEELVQAPRPYQGDQAMAPTQPKEENTMRPLAIRQLNHGYVIEVGCQTFAIESPATLIAKLAEYITNPAATENRWREGKLF